MKRETSVPFNDLRSLSQDSDPDLNPVRRPLIARIKAWLADVVDRNERQGGGDGAGGL